MANYNNKISYFKKHFMAFFNAKQYNPHWDYELQSHNQFSFYFLSQSASKIKYLLSFYACLSSLSSERNEILFIIQNIVFWKSIS